MIPDIDSFNSDNTYKSYFLGEIWKPLRKMLTGIFSTGKLKAMLPPLMTVSNKNLDYLEKEVAKNPVLNVKPIVQGIFSSYIMSLKYVSSKSCLFILF